MSDLDFGDDGDWDPTNAQIAENLLAYVCPPGEPWTGDSDTSGHGHTQCFWIGLAIERLRAADPASP